MVAVRARGGRSASRQGVCHKGDKKGESSGAFAVRFHGLAGRFRLLFQIETFYQSPQPGVKNWTNLPHLRKQYQPPTQDTGQGIRHPLIKKKIATSWTISFLGRVRQKILKGIRLRSTLKWVETQVWNAGFLMGRFSF